MPHCAVYHVLPCIQCVVLYVVGSSAARAAPSSRCPSLRFAPAHKLLIRIQYQVKNTSLGGGLPVLQIKIPFRIHLLGSWEGGICTPLILFSFWPLGGKQPSIYTLRTINFSHTFKIGFFSFQTVHTWWGPSPCPSRCPWRSSTWFFLYDSHLLYLSTQFPKAFSA